ncbi:MAG: dihydrofolate reductase [bacterium]
MARPEIVIIAAVAEKNRVIGRAGKLPWYFSEDLKRFKRLTLGHTVLMGRKTFESIVERLGKPLPGRKNIVLTARKSFPEFAQVVTFPSLEDAFKAVASQDQVFIIGGETVYQKTLHLAHQLELTIVEGDYEGDAFFPEYQNLLKEQFTLVESQPQDGYRFETYRRIK